jgi:hypothetical protein
LPVGSINRLVIHPQARRKTLSKKFDIYRLNEAENLGCKTICAWWTSISGNKRLECLKSYGFKLNETTNRKTVSHFGEVFLSN